MANGDSPVDLLLRAHARAPLELVFGDDGAAPPVPQYTVRAAGAVTGVRGGVRVHATATLRAEGRISGLRGGARMHYDVNVDRPLAQRAAVRWQQALGAGVARAARWQQADACGAAQAVRWRDGRATGVIAQARGQQARALSTLVRQRWQQADACGVAQAMRWQQAQPHTWGVAARWQRALAGGVDLRGAYEQARSWAVWRADRWQQGAAGCGVSSDRFGGWAGAGARMWAVRWQEARGPDPGISVRPSPPRGPRCYEPEAHMVLRFAADTPAAALDLLFACGAGGGGSVPPALVVVVSRGVYRMLNSVELRRVDTNELLPVLGGFGMSLDMDSFTWSFSVDLLGSALSRVVPGGDGLPVELELRVNGAPYRMLAQRWRRSVQFPRSVITLGGGSPNALLAAPHAPLLSFQQPAARTARQLVDDVLSINGVPLGWGVDWQLTDWPVPAGTWAHHGSWATALIDIAGSVGGYVQPHDTARTLRILPAFPHAAWNWAAVVPQFQLPAGVASIEETEAVRKPDYNAIYLHGEPGTSLFHRYKPASAADATAPMAVHPLLVHPDAAAQRAIAALSDTGRQLAQRLTLPILPETGIIKPGVYVRYTDDGGAQRLGLVRATTVADGGEAAIRQTIAVLSYE